MLGKMLAQQFERTQGGMPVETKSLPSGLHFRARLNQHGIKEIVCWRMKGFETRTPALEHELATMAKEAGMSDHHLESVSKSGYWLVREGVNDVGEFRSDLGQAALAPPAAHNDGLPERLRPMVETAMRGEGLGKMVLVSGSWGSGLVRDENEYILEWYSAFVQSRSNDSLERLEAMWRALNPAAVTWEQLGTVTT